MMSGEQVQRTINRFIVILGIIFLIITGLTILEPGHAYTTILIDVFIGVILVFLYLVKPEKK